MDPIEVEQRQSGIYRAILRNDSGTPLSNLAVDSFTLTLYDRNTLAIINSRNVQNALNVNQVTLDSNGNVTWTWLPNDTTVLNPAKEIEEHVALFVAKWTDGGGLARELPHEILMRVKRVQKVT